MLCSTGEHKAGLTQRKVSLCCFEVPLVLLDLDCNMGDLVIKLPVACDLPHQAPIISLSHRVLKKVEVASWPGEQMVEPRG
jgi:hypothetical protein